jgi:Tol biopolymer transport system component
VGVLSTRSQPQIHAPTFSRVTRLPADVASATQPVLSPDQKWVAYFASTEDRTDVCVKYLNGGQTVNLTANEHEVEVAFLPDIGTLDISPDGALIAFGGGAKGAATNQLSTYVLPAPLGGTPRKLVDHGLALRWSPDGRRIAYIKPGWGAGDSLWVADANGEHPREIMRASGGIHAHWPAWSADSRFVYFNYSVNTGNLEPVEVFRVPADGGEPEKVIATSRRAMYAFPSLDGRGLLYSSNPVGVEMGVWWKPVSGPPIPVTTGVGEYGEPRLSRDGRTMVATVFQVRQWLAALSISNGPAITPIGSGATRDIDATVSPAGDRMAFSSTRNGERNIWTSDLSGANARLVTAGPAIDERPAWSPDGRRIAFVSDRGGQRGIWITDSDGGAPRHVVDAQVLDTIAWSPDGTQLVYAESVNFKAGLFLVPAHGGSPPRRLQTPAGATAPTWSVATNVIAYVGIHEATQSQPMRAEVGFLTPSGQIPRPPLSAGIDLAYGTIAWSPDEKAIAGVGNVGGVGVAPAVWLLPLEGPGRRLRELPKRPRGLTWTHDGSQLIVGFEERTGELVLFDQGR